MRRREKKKSYLEIDDIVAIINRDDLVEMKTMLISLAYAVHDLQCTLEDMDNEMRGYDP